MAKKMFTTVSRDEKSYVPRDWLDENGKPEKGALTFKYKPLSKKQLAVHQDNSSRMSLTTNTFYLGNATISIDVFRTAVTGWENFIVDGAERPYKKDGLGLVEEEVVEILPLDLIEEVAGHILKVSRFPEEEVKK